MSCRPARQLAGWIAMRGNSAARSVKRPHEVRLQHADVGKLGREVTGGSGQHQADQALAVSRHSARIERAIWLRSACRIAGIDQALTPSEAPDPPPAPRARTRLAPPNRLGTTCQRSRSQRSDSYYQQRLCSAPAASTHRKRESSLRALSNGSCEGLTRGFPATPLTYCPCGRRSSADRV